MTRYYAIPVGKECRVRDGRLLEAWSPTDRPDPTLSGPFLEAWDRLCEDASDSSVWKCSGCGEEMPGSDTNDHQDGVGGEFVCGPVAPVGETIPPDGRYWLVGPGVVRCADDWHLLGKVMDRIESGDDRHVCPSNCDFGFLNPLGLARPELWAENDGRLEVTVFQPLEYSSEHALAGHCAGNPDCYYARVDTPDEEGFCTQGYGSVDAALRAFVRCSPYAGIRIIRDDGSREDVVR